MKRAKAAGAPSANRAEQETGKAVVENIIRTQELLKLESEIIERKNRIAVNILEIGDRLIIAKGMLDHGQFLNWLSNNVSLSDRTARNYMRAARAFPEPKRKAISNLTGTNVLLLAELPDSTRDSFMQEYDIASMTTRELRTAIRSVNATADISQFFSTDYDEAMQEFDIDINKLKPLPFYQEYMSLFGIEQRVGDKYIHFLQDMQKGYMPSIIITKNNYIIDGVERVRAAKDLGYKTIKARYLYVKNHMGMGFEQICRRYFLDLLRWSFWRQSIFYIITYAYLMEMNDKDAAEWAKDKFIRDGEEIDAKNRDWMENIKIKYPFLE